MTFIGNGRYFNQITGKLRRFVGDFELWSCDILERYCRGSSVIIGVSFPASQASQY